MAKALQRRRGTHEEHKNFVGLEGEFTYDTTEKRIVAHDGATKGGIPLAKKEEVEQVANSLDPRILDAASQSDILEAVSQATVGNTQEPPEGLMLSHVVGEEWHSFTGQIPVGGVPYCGQLVTREVYRDLWEYAQTQGLVKTESEWQSIASAQNGNVAFYSTGDGSTTFRMPSIKGYVKGASSQAEAGEYVAEGLPNITASTTYNVISNNSGFSGAFTGNELGAHVNATAMTTAGLGFDASLSNPIYGNSDHVTPETNTVLFGVFAFGNITNVGELDAETLATGLANVEANKLERSDRAEIVGWGMPDYTAGMSLSANSPAPTNGFVVCEFNVGAGAEHSLVIDGTQVAYIRSHNNYTGMNIKFMVPISKGQKASGETWFFPLKGAN